MENDNTFVTSMSNSGVDEQNKTMYKLTNVNRDEFLAPFDQLFDELFATNFPQLTSELGSDFFAKGSYPKVDVIEYADKIVLEADVSGLCRDEVSAELDGEYLTIKGGNKPRDIPSKDSARYIYREIKRSSFQRSFQLGKNIDKSKVKAEFKDGLLVVELPRVKVEEKPKKVKLL